VLSYWRDRLAGVALILIGRCEWWQHPGIWTDTRPETAKREGIESSGRI